jgi:predicted lipoprotein with Yx(FWY)xxD motif
MTSLKRLVPLALTVSVGAGGIAAFATATATAGSTTVTPPTITLMSTNKGKLLGVGGFVVYRFSHDGTGHTNTCVKISGCPSAWPALTTVGKPHTGPGVNASLLGTTKLPNGSEQVTYAGHPIYRYAFGTKGSTSYVGIFAAGGYWYGVNASGGDVK